MMTFYDDTDKPDAVAGDDFQLHKPASRASTLGISSNTFSRPLRAQPDALQRAHTITQPASAKRTGRAMATDRGRKPHQRASSLLRLKTSGNDNLPQRLLAHDLASASRIDNTFAVANVGNNGKLYLRPLVESGSRRHHGKSLSKLSPPAPVNVTRQPPPRPITGPDSRHSILSSSQFSELHPKFAREEITEVNDDADDTELRRRRAHSFSTISEYDQSETGDEFRIVIDRLDTHEAADITSQPPLHVPIPHYRLGSLQFNADGTPVLRSSVYTHTSDNTNPSVYLKDSTGNTGQNRIPSTYDSPGLSHPVGTLSAAMSLFSGVAPSATKARNSNSTYRSGMYSVRHPIEPSIFDVLAENMDDPALVKYLPGTADISAATPARIVAQISSEAFMDYELVSDFFLTFRSYLSTTDLLGLLLARLEWAIKRLQPDGRIIRIRTFAALRHWILNYFVDDFVSNWDLRAQFCDTINRMYDELKSRSTVGVSDIKILVDLKRCWYGRCLVHWDCPLFTSPDNPALPGGVLNSQENNTARLSKITNSFQEGGTENAFPKIPSEQLRRPSIGVEGVRNIEYPSMHARTISSGTSRSFPGSSSEQSVQAQSCSFPGKSASIPMNAMDSRHPVVVVIQPSHNTPTGPRSPTTPSTFKYPVHAHKRSGSFSDSIRDDRAPLSRALPDRQDQEQALLPTPDGGNGSLIRGNLFPPIDARVTGFAPPSPTISQASDGLQDHHARSASEGNIKPLRTVIGSIRRALHTRNIGQVSTAHPAYPNPRSQRGKTATLPVNVEFKSDIYRERRAHPKPEIPLRVDYISEQIVRDYREAIGLNPPAPSIAEGPSQPRSQPSHSKPHQTHDQQRLVSEVTMGSKSIVIVDDTGLDLPVVSGGLGWLGPDQTSNASSHALVARKESSPGTIEVPVAASSELLRHEGKNLNLAPFDLPIQRFSTSQSISSRLRKYASFHSGVSHSFDGSSESGEKEIGKKPTSRLLRRRPGGDLRKIQNVHDLAPDQRPLSFATDTSLTESYTSSVRQYLRRSFSRSSQARTQSTPPRFDLINTHSSQHLRPSFEAAIAEFSRIPDDVDGGIESTLLKLEGKWPSPTLSDSRAEGDGYQNTLTRKFQHDTSDIALKEASPSGDLPMRSDETIVSFPHSGPRSQVDTDSFVESEFSDNSIPLLERGLSDDSMKKPVSGLRVHYRTHQSALTGSVNNTDSPRPSIQLIDDRDRIRQLKTNIDEYHDVDSHSEQYENVDSRSELSSELSVEFIEKDDALEASSSTDSLATQSLEIPPHPLAHPPSPPITIPQAVSTTTYRKPQTPINASATLTPGPSPTRMGDQYSGRRNLDESAGIEHKLGRLHIETPQMPNHFPFVLAYDSRILAQQFTLVEKSALDEVDWKDLVEMKWNNTSPSIVSWVHFLAEKERKGIDIVVGRFNLMVKWVLSEIVLTRDFSERARTITKFIHIAAHARQICNYSTMLQIAIALSSVDCTRLQRTWELVSINDRRLLDSMEFLIQPLRNFHELRVEMETANLQNGCIPFVGLYVHDLTYNAQKPSQVAGTRDGDSLVNFERYRTSARIVKCLLRLIDASNKYNIEPVPGVVEKCLWIGSLPEEQIQAYSKSLE
ncbi:guanine nucleotide exchange factor, putative [Talaromyces stipitatus ATCC 10500]|uniref:Guanine nucleotide exchange factor, putative n=1 Tax=Talaromyces stipitatus (strain ATCC 10500 / CBS 375.48 / QM 6759 / NRRL 1006) TaxID=441959 RepID=B8M650_TALSN|nr:guanine nucleotide exchange factor, putative [Talaromyces stipitatus ATCC 10500]EED19050.1 guanine nucleotide exchange factor, putative [Talaromyces stipitatus ATCC 10500]